MNRKPIRVVVDASIPYLRGRIPQGIEASFVPNEQITRDLLKGQDALLVRSVTRCNESLLSDTGVQCIATATAGFDHIDRDYCDRHAIQWSNAPGCNASGVVQYVLSALALWAQKEHRSISTFRIGIVGAGHVGGLLAQRLCALGATILVCDPPRAEREGTEGFYTLSQLAEKCDVITFHTPLTQTSDYPTYHLADRLFVEKCQKKKPLLINAARGAVWDTQAILSGLDRGMIAGVIVDCWEGEPNLSLDLLHKAFLATPHIAGFSTWGKAHGARMALAFICKCLGVDFSTETLIVPEDPQSDVIDLSSAEDPITTALISTFDPRAIERALRQSPERFEELRVSYPFHHEMSSFRLSGASRSVLDRLEQAGFCPSSSKE